MLLLNLLLLLSLGIFGKLIVKKIFETLHLLLWGLLTELSVLLKIIFILTQSFLVNGCFWIISQLLMVYFSSQLLLFAPILRYIMLDFSVLLVFIMWSFQAPVQLPLSNCLETELIALSHGIQIVISRMITIQHIFISNLDILKALHSTDLTCS